MRLPNPKENRSDADGQFLSDCFTSARDAGDDMQRALNNGQMEDALWWAQRSAYWWNRVVEALENMKVKV